MFETIDTSMIDWSRAQFALTAMYHWLFVPLTLGLAVVMGTMETLYVVTGKEFWKRTAQFWMKLFGINFAVGSSRLQPSWHFHQQHYRQQRILPLCRAFPKVFLRQEQVKAPGPACP